MGSEVEILGLNPSNLPAFGEVLHNQFVGHTDYKKLWMPNWGDSNYKQNVIDAISDIYTKVGLSGYVGTPQGQYPLPIRIGDILNISVNQHIYVVTGYDTNFIRTFPSYTSEDEQYFDSRIIAAPFAIRRPALSSINFDKYAAVVRDTLPKELVKDQKRFGGTFNANKLPDDSTHLQVGDLIFNVDPVQISFTTQNGFQYFPTLRTNGNPKLPTDQQIKNMNVVLIFPNEDAINYQLLPLYAMFRRTPFVNIRNRDISKFYDDIKSPEGYVPVALESIQIQSIDGFPNSLQATLSLLPFEPGLINNGALRALKSFDDVYIQQKHREAGSELEYLLNISDNKMQEESPTSVPTRFKGLTRIVTNHTENFRESFPFRAFYQSLIAENKVVKDEYGNEEQLFGKQNNVKASADISFLAPVNKDNALHHYRTDGNRTPIAFTYKYLLSPEGKDPKELRDAGKYISEQRINQDKKRLDWLHDTMKIFTEWKAIPLAMFTAFPNLADAIRPFDYQFGKMDQVINTVLMQYGLSHVKIAGPLKEADFGTVLGFMFKNMLYNTGIPQAWNNAVNVKAAADQLKPLKGMNANDAFSLLGKGNLNYTDAHIGELSEYGIHTLNKAFESLWETLNADKTGKMKEKFLGVIEGIANALTGELTSIIEVKDRDATTTESPYYVKYLPIATKKVEIDNKYDVITSWSLTFANKFVPVSLIAYKYPFYQHLGSEDATLSLVITSVPSDVKNDLKAQLSEMSDKIYDSVKLVNYTAPDLYLWMDPRVEIDADAGHIFHAFGIRKVVLNSSNTTNIQGQPDAWNTVINLTQANFSIEQYHSIESIPTTNELEAILANLIPRLKLNDDGTIVVRKFASPKTLTIDDVLMLSFLGSQAGARWWFTLSKVLKKVGINVNIADLDNVSAQATKEKKIIGDQILQQIFPAIEKVSGIDFNKTDAAATGAIQSACASNRKFEQLLKAIIKEYDTMLDRQGEVFESMVDTYNSIWTLIGTGYETMIKDEALLAAGTLIVIIAMTVLTGGLILPGLLLTGFILGSAGACVHGVFDAATQAAVDKGRDKFGGAIQKMLNVYKKEMLLQLTHAILKDPPIRKRLFAPAIVNLVIPPKVVGNQEIAFDVEQAIKERESFGRINCYKDFDVPLVWTIDGRNVRSSPDFYLYNYNDPLYYAQTYIRDSTERMLTAARRGIQMCLVEHKELLDRFDVLISGVRDSKNLEQILFGPSGVTGIAQELGYVNNLQDSQLQLAQMYRIATLQENGTISDITREKKNLSLSQDKKNEYLGEFANANAELRKKDLTAYQNELKAFEYFLDTGITPKVDIDKKKLNLVWTARMRCLLELVAMASAIESYYSSASITTGGVPVNEKEMEKIKNKTDLSDADAILGTVAKAQLSKLNDAINGVLKNWQTVTSNTLNAEGKLDPGLEIAKSQTSKGLSSTPVKADAKLNLPSIKVLENEVYNKIGYYIRLNTAIEQYNETGQAINLDNLPDLQMLDVWNLRTTESAFRQLEIEKQYFDSMRRQNAPTLKFFPTFKVYFIEEDTGRSNLLDDFYAYNAVQTIEISRNKNSSSSVAVLRLSNLTGTMTDKLSFHRERSDFATQRDPFASGDEAFFGTLDVKPGTKVQIKMGYAADERYLPTVFTGRIIEMQVGPTTEMICQSFGAQLQHKIYTAKFGFFASEKEYGDIASALLDMIPGLENLGKKDIITFGLLGGFSGRDIGKLRKSLFDNFLLTNLLGKLTADIKATDNPRDENIYLPFNLSLYAPNKPRFDWVVYNQSVWNAIQELCLYTQNTEPVIKQFNNDPFSSRSEQRETLVIGDKSGYYKYTDSLSLSSLDTDSIEQAIKQFDVVKPMLNNSKLKAIARDITGTPKLYGLIAGWESQLRMLGYSSLEKNVPDPYSELFNTPKYRHSRSFETKEYHIEGVLLNTDWINAWKFFSNPLNVNIIKKRCLQSIDISIRKSWQFITQKMDQEITKAGLNNWHASKAIEALTVFSNSSIPRDPVNTPIPVELADVFTNIIFHMTALGQMPAPDFRSTDYSIDNNGNASANRKPVSPSSITWFWDLSVDEFYGVTGGINNTNPALSMDPRYRKIQQHYLITDSTNLIDNSISLNSNFSNMVNVYYLDEPQFINGIDGVPPEKFDKLNVWTIKAFGDIKDEHARPLDTFQKNIDPWWFDIAEKQGAFFKGFRRLNYQHMTDISKTGKKESKDFNRYIESLSSGVFNLGTPDWRAFPAFQVVGVNLLKKQVAQMYRGAIQIVGDCSIEPMDIVHLEDYINDMHGVVEVEEVVHTFTPDRGLITTITPSLITYDRDPIQHEDVGIINRIYDIAETKRKVTNVKVVGGILAATLGTTLAVKGGQPVIGTALGGGGALAAVSGLKSIIGQDYHKFLYEQMGNIIGRDCINFTALMYHGMPYMCGFDGLDYTSLKTLMIHKVEGLENPVSRITAFSDPFAASVYTNFNPANFGAGQAIVQGTFLKWLVGYPTHGRLNDAFTVWDRLNPLGSG